MYLKFQKTQFCSVCMCCKSLILISCLQRQLSWDSEILFLFLIRPQTLAVQGLQERQVLSVFIICLRVNTLLHPSDHQDYFSPLLLFKCWCLLNRVSNRKKVNKNYPKDLHPVTCSYHRQSSVKINFDLNRLPFLQNYQKQADFKNNILCNCMLSIHFLTLQFH